MNGLEKKRGFSLVELIIVIVILGVIAAIAVPRISRGAKGADESSLRQDLSILRTAIEMYAAEHGGDYPASKTGQQTETFFRNQLLQYSKKTGETSATKTGDYIYGPYLRKDIPPLPVGAKAGSREVKVANTGPAYDESSTAGWVYNYATGEVIANANNGSEADPNVTYDSW